MKSNPTLQTSWRRAPSYTSSSKERGSQEPKPLVVGIAVMSKLGAFMSAVPSGSAAAAAPASTTSPDFTPAAAAQPAPEPVTPEDTKVKRTQ